MNEVTPKRVLIAAGGTGGHIFPALHVANAFRLKYPSIEIDFVGSGRPLEEKILGGKGFGRHVFSAVGVKRRGIRGVIQFILSLPRAIKEVWTLISKVKPEIVIGMGGYVSVLPICIARIRGIPTWIHEAEIRPGLANWFLSLVATKTSVAFEDAKMPFWARTVATGHPVRSDLKEGKKPTDENFDIKRILVVGGSQGARGLDNGMMEITDLLAFNKLEVCHQSRPEAVKELSEKYKSNGVNAQVVSFIEDMPGAYDWADIIIARAGANTVMELSVVNKPVIFVPYPFAQGDHQTANAKTMSDANKAILVKEGENFGGRLREALSALLSTKEYKEMMDRPKVGRSKEASEQIVSGCVDLVR